MILIRCMKHQTIPNPTSYDNDNQMQKLKDYMTQFVHYATTVATFLCDAPRHTSGNAYPSRLVSQELQLEVGTKSMGQIFTQPCLNGSHNDCGSADTKERPSVISCYTTNRYNERSGTGMMTQRRSNGFGNFTNQMMKTNQRLPKPTKTTLMRQLQSISVVPFNSTRLPSIPINQATETERWSTAQHKKIEKTPLSTKTITICFTFPKFKPNKKNTTPF